MGILRNGNGLGAGQRLGQGWHQFSTIFGGGDYNGDGWGAYGVISSPVVSVWFGAELMEDHMSRRLLALMAEVGDTFPVWERTPGEEVGELDPETSGLSEQLIQELIAWNSRSHELLFSDAPVENKYDYERNLDQWTKEGRSLAKRIEIELGQEIDVHVAYRY